MNLWPFHRKPKTAPEHPVPPDPHPKSGLRENFETLCEVAIFVLFARTFVFQNSQIPSGSMVHTLEIGDHILTNSFIYGPTAGGWENKILPVRPIARGDIVVFKFPGDPTVDFVKRAIAFEGETVLLYNSRVFIRMLKNDGTPQDHYTPLEEEYTNLPPGLTTGPVHPPFEAELLTPVEDLPCFREQPERFLAHDYGRMNGGVEPSLVNPVNDDGTHRNWGPYRIPKNHLFAMGDNRDNSLDGRVWGALDLSLIKGRGWLVWWSFNEAKYQEQGGPAYSADYTKANKKLEAGNVSGLEKAGSLLYILAFKARHFLDGTRWERTGHRPMRATPVMRMRNDATVKVPADAAPPAPQG